MRDVLDQLERSTHALCDALDGIDLDAPTLLPDWSRLTIACHLRYGAEALHRMTIDALAGRPTAYYPEGRETQRPGTLVAHGDDDVVAGLRATSDALHETWRTVDDWTVTVDEPEGVFPDLAAMLVLRLTEIEVHGTDLDLGLPPWSDVLVDAALPRRLERLRARTPLAPGAWIIDGTRIGDPDGDAERIDVTPRELFALTLGRWNPSETFARAYPGP